MNTPKEILRENLISTRSAMKRQDVVEKSQVICQKIITTIDWLSVHTIHIYSSTTSWNEVDTEKIKYIIANRWPHIRVDSPSRAKSAPLPVQKYSLIIVPTLGFDKNNYRLGMGGGWYDRFLVKQPQAQKIGLAYAFCRIDVLPREPHDIRLDRIITE